jgi:CelD/BcsL family acetyltransferase involved in cellulose biosynthesis
MVEIVSYIDLAGLEPLDAVWDRLCEMELQYVPSFAEMRWTLQSSGAKFRVLTAAHGGEIVAMACFIFRNATKPYHLAARRLFELPIREVCLFGSCVPGQPSEEVIRSFFQIIFDEADFDLVSLGEILTETSLYKAIKSLPKGAIAWPSSRKGLFRWMILLPESFDKYIASLGPITRRGVNRDCRRFANANPDYRIYERADEIETFLRDAEHISRLTYQSKLGYGVLNNEATRERLSKLAKSGELRCYVTYLNGQPCAFGWGALTHRTFAFLQTGYLPQYGRLSPGTSTIMYMFRDLIENTNCRVFDFLTGSETGYKSRLCPLRLDCAQMYVAKSMRPYVLFIVALDRTIILAKHTIMALGGLVVGSGAFNRRVKRLLRPLGIVTY